MSAGTILAIVIPLLVVLAAILVAGAARRRETDAALGSLSRETRRKDRGRALDAAIAAFVAWVALLAFAGGTGLQPFARRLGGIFSLPGWAMLVITPLFAGSLAWGVAALLGSRRPSPGARSPASNP